ncbi:preprotein translocase subunit SecA [Buchnera aphidicola (Tuberolachnus salignus)]
MNHNQKVLNSFKPLIIQINQLEQIFSQLSDEELKNKTLEFRRRLKIEETLDSLLPEAFATVREASKRVLGMRHFDVQLLGGIVLHSQSIAEMCTGEGKTLTATLPAYLHSLTGQGVHIITMNDYLAERDAKKNSVLFNFLGISVGINVHGLSFTKKKNAYQADITYGTNHEYGFDYLRDNMIFSHSEKVQRNLYFGLIDEIDSILIDEARTPLVISGATQNNNDLYFQINELIPFFIAINYSQKQIDYKNNLNFVIDYKRKQINLTEKGMKKFENLLIKKKFLSSISSLYTSKNIIFLHHFLLALRAHILFLRNIDYIVMNKKVIIVDEHTGRMMFGRRWSDGLHQAIEAKENVPILNENKTLASITLQNYFRLYKKLSGMTGTAITESYEFNTIYNLDTIVIPPNKPMIRKDFSDLVYITEKEKIKAIIKDICQCVSRKQPVLVGTISIQKSEMISNYLKKMNISHNILNAKFHAQEAKIISSAGQLSAVTIATNMAGRGTDIVLGGSFFTQFEKNFLFNKKYTYKIYKKEWKKRHQLVVETGGLHIIGTERHESRRIDNQLCGRSGRQGDPGSSRFYLSLEDSLMKLFISKKTIQMIYSLGINSKQVIEHSWVNKAIQNAQKKLENQNFNLRKQLLEYDNIFNEQRQAIYSERKKIVNSYNVEKYILNLIKDFLKKTLKKLIISKNLKDLNIMELDKLLKKLFYYPYTIEVIFKKKKKLKKNLKILKKILIQKILKHYILKLSSIKNKYRLILEKCIILQTFDLFWQDHLNIMESVRQGIHLRGYAQKNPKQEYQKESFLIFKNMLHNIKYTIVKNVFQIFFVDFSQKKFLYKNCILHKDYETLNLLLLNKNYKKK